MVKDHSGSIGVMRFNCLYPPFDNPAIRRIVLSAIDQRAFMDAVAGADPELIRTGIGLFVPGTPLASDVGVSHDEGPEGSGEAEGGTRRRRLQGRAAWCCWRPPTFR